MCLAEAEGLQEWKRLGEDLAAMTAFPIERFLGNLGAESVFARALAGRFWRTFRPLASFLSMIQYIMDKKRTCQRARELFEAFLTSRRKGSCKTAGQWRV